MEVVGAISGGLTLCVYLTQAGIAIRKAIKGIKNSRRDIAELSDETVIFAGLCEEFLRTCNDNSEVRSPAASSISPLITWIKRTKNELCELLRDVKALRPDPRCPQSIQTTLIAHLKWFFSKSMVKSLRASMAVARESIEGFSNIMCIKKLNKQLRMLKDALKSPSTQRYIEKSLGMAIQQKIRLVEQAIDIKSSIRDTNKRRLKVAKRKMTQQQPTTSPAPTELLDFTTSLDTYAEAVLPSVRSRHRTNNLRADRSSTTSEYPAPLRRRSSDAHSTTGGHTSSSSSTISTCSSQVSINTSTSTLGFSEPEEVIQSAPRHKNMTRVMSRSYMATERPNLKTREYMNDPNGTILSPPKLVERTGSGPARKIMKIGRHTITLASTCFTLNKSSLEVNDYEIAEAFFRAVSKHRDKLEELDRILAKRHRMADDFRWTGIPDWEITSRQIKCLSSGLKTWGL